MGDAGLPRSLQESLDNTKVSYAQLGKSGLRVSIPILGAMSFGMFTLMLLPCALCPVFVPMNVIPELLVRTYR